MLILGIETSCDDTCAAVVEARGGKKHPRFRILSNIVSSQVKVHAPFGGVVPNLAAREHAANIVPVLEKALNAAGSVLRIPSHEVLKRIDLVAVTNTPGLLPALLIGVHAARALAYALKKPILGINHLEGHIAANWLTPENMSNKGDKGTPNTLFPAIALIVSGGHTQLVLMRDQLKFRVIGETRDDAAGEAFDKVARLIGLPFPGGPPIARLAQSAQKNAESDTHASAQNNADQTQNNAEKKFSVSQRSVRESPRYERKSALRLPRPMINSDDFDFSFSGLKTAVLYLLEDLAKNTRAVQKVRGGNQFRILRRQLLEDLCASFQQAVVDVLIAKTVRATKKYGARTVILGGGVAANTELKRQLGDAVKALDPVPHFLYPPPSLALDNAAMIAAAAYFRWMKGERKTWREIRVRV